MRYFDLFATVQVKSFFNWLFDKNFLFSLVDCIITSVYPEENDRFKGEIEMMIWEKVGIVAGAKSLTRVGF